MRFKVDENLPIDVTEMLPEAEAEAMGAPYYTAQAKALLKELESP